MAAELRTGDAAVSGSCEQQQGSDFGPCFHVDNGATALPQLLSSILLVAS